MSMRRLSSNPGCSVLIVVAMSCLRFSPMKSEKGTRLGKMSSSVKRLRFRLSTVSNRAWMSTSEWPYVVSRRRTGWRVVFLEAVLQTGEQVSNVFQGLENDLNRVSSIRACVVLRSCFLSTGKVLAGGLLEK